MHPGNTELMRNAATSYYGRFREVACGLHVSEFKLDFPEALRRLRMVSAGELTAGNVLYIPWRGATHGVLVRLLRVLELISRSSSAVSLAEATFAYLGDEEQHGTFDNASLLLIHALSWAPVVLFASGAADSALGNRLRHGRRVLVARPTELQPLLAIYREACHYQ